MYRIAVLQHTCSIILLGILENVGETTQIIIKLQTEGCSFTKLDTLHEVFEDHDQTKTQLWGRSP